MKFWLVVLSVTLCVSNCLAVLNYGKPVGSAVDSTAGYQYKVPSKQNFQPTATQIDETQKGYQYQAPAGSQQQPLELASAGYQHSSFGRAVPLDLEPGLAAGATAQADNYFAPQSSKFADNNGYHDNQSQQFMPRPQQQPEQQLEVLNHPNSISERQKYFLQKLEQHNLQSGTQTAPSNAKALAAFLSKYVNANKAYNDPNQQSVQKNQGYNYNKARPAHTAQSDSQSVAQTQHDDFPQKNYVDEASAQYDSQLSQSAAPFLDQSAQLGSQSTHSGSHSAQYDSQSTQPANHLAAYGSPPSHFGSQTAFNSNHLESTQHYPQGSSFGVAAAQHGTPTPQSDRQAPQFDSILNNQQNHAQSDFVGASSVALETPLAHFGSQAAQSNQQSAQFDSKFHNVQNISPQDTQSAQFGNLATQFGSPSKQFGSQSAQFESPTAHFGSQSAQFESPTTHFGSHSAQSENPTAHFGSQSAQLESPSKHFGSQSAQFESPSKHFGSQSAQFESPSTHFGSQSAKLESPTAPFGSQSAQFPNPSTHFGSQSAKFESPTAHFGSQSAQFESPTAHFGSQSAHFDNQPANSHGQAAQFGNQAQFPAQNNGYKYANHAAQSSNGFKSPSYEDNLATTPSLAQNAQSYPYPTENAALNFHTQHPNHAPATSTLPQYAANHKGLGHYNYTPSKPQAVTAASNTALLSGEQYQAQSPQHSQHSTASALTPLSHASGYDYIQMQSHSFELPLNFAQKTGAQSPTLSSPAVHRPHATYGVPAQQLHAGFAASAADSIVAPAANYLPHSNKFQTPYF